MSNETMASAAQLAQIDSLLTTAMFGTVTVVGIIIFWNFLRVFTRIGEENDENEDLDNEEYEHKESIDEKPININKERTDRKSDYYVETKKEKSDVAKMFEED